MAPTTRAKISTPEEEAAELRANVDVMQTDVGKIKKKLEELDGLKLMIKNLIIAVEANKNHQGEHSSTPPTEQSDLGADKVTTLDPETRNIADVAESIVQPPKTASIPAAQTSTCPPVPLPQHILHSRPPPLVHHFPPPMHEYNHSPYPIHPIFFPDPQFHLTPLHITNHLMLTMLAILHIILLIYLELHLSFILHHTLHPLTIITNNSTTILHYLALITNNSTTILHHLAPITSNNATIRPHHPLNTTTITIRA
jgi:hypothetical protein